MLIQATSTSNNQPISLCALSEERACDLCAAKHDLIDLVPCPTGVGYYCHDCVDVGDVASYLRRKHGLSKDKFEQFLKTINL